MRKLIALTVLLFLGVETFAGSNGNNENGRDTTYAVATFEMSSAFIPSPIYSTDDYSQMIDSLVQLDTVPVGLVNRLNIYRLLASEDPEHLPLVIDSIFEAEDVPEPVLLAVNDYMLEFDEFMRLPSGFAAYIPQTASPYPADAFYGTWNTMVPNPERNNLAQFDSTLKLLLVDTAQNCDFHTPFEGVVTSYFGWRYGRNHNGIDIDLEVWDPVHSAFPGVVRVARYYKGYGRVVVVRHYNGLETIYAHLHRFKVKPGDIVEAGDVIGLGGSSGNSTGSHLHFEVRFQGVPIKPSQIIDFGRHQLRSSEIVLERSGSFLAAKPENSSDRPKEYLVKHGEGLYNIARKFGVSVDDLCNLNKLAPDSRLEAGQKIILKI